MDEIDFVYKTNLVVSALNSEEMAYLDDTNFKNILYDAIDNEYARKIKLRKPTPEEILHVRSIVVPIIRENPQVKKKLLQAKKRYQQRVGSHINSLINRLSGPLSKGELMHLDNGFTIGLDHFTGVITLTSADFYDCYYFYTLPSCAEFIAMNDEIFENKDDWKNKLKVELFKNEDFVQNIAPQIEEIVKSITKHNTMTFSDADIVAAALIDVSMGEHIHQTVEDYDLEDEEEEH